LRYSPCIRLEGWGKLQKNFSQDMQFLGCDLNQERPEHETGALPTEPRHSIFILYVCLIVVPVTMPLGVVYDLTVIL
jgi:hypothetical protein